MHTGPPALPQTLDYIEGEAPASFLSRLAMANGSNLSELASILGIKVIDVIDGAPATTEWLAQMGGVAPDRIAQATFRRIGTRSFVRGGHQLPRQSVVYQVARICPACLREDARLSGKDDQIGMGFRSNWQVPFLRSCTRHNVALVPGWSCADRVHRHDFASRVGLILPAILTGTLDGPPVPPSPFERWIEQRLAGETGGLWLEQFDFFAAATFCELLGRAILLDRVSKNLKLTEIQWRHAADLGFRSAAAGEAGIRKTLLDVQERGGSPNDGPHARFGPLYDRFSRDLDGPEFDPFRKVLQDHLLTTWPLAAGENVLGKLVEKRLLHSVRSLANQTGLGTARLRKALVDAGLVAESSPRSDAWDVFDAEAAESLVLPLLEGLGLSDVVESFNFPRDQFEAMVTGSFIKSLPTGEGTYPAFLASEITAFLDIFLGVATPMSAAQHDFTDIPTAARRLLCSSRDIARLAIEGRLQRIGRHTGRKGYLSILVNVREIQPLLLRETAIGMTVEQVSETLGLAAGEVRALIRDGVLQATLAPNPITQKPQYYVTEAQLRDFCSTFVTLKHVAAWLDLDRDITRKELQASKVRPIGPPERPYGFAYRRIKIGERFASTWPRSTRLPRTPSMVDQGFTASGPDLEGF